MISVAGFTVNLVAPLKKRDYRACAIAFCDMQRNVSLSVLHFLFETFRKPSESALNSPDYAVNIKHHGVAQYIVSASIQ